MHKNNFVPSKLPSFFPSNYLFQNENSLDFFLENKTLLRFFAFKATASNKRRVSGSNPAAAAYQQQPHQLPPPGSRGEADGGEGSDSAAVGAVLTPPRYLKSHFLHS